jgi:hypothetical protein
MKFILLKLLILLVTRLIDYSIWQKQLQISDVLIGGTTFLSTGGPRNSRNFYQWFRLFAIQENILKFNLVYLRSFPHLFAVS